MRVGLALQCASLMTLLVAAGCSAKGELTPKYRVSATLSPVPDSTSAPVHAAASQLPPRGEYKHRAKISISYDRVRGYSAITLHEVHIGSGLVLTVFTTYMGTKLTDVPDHVTFMLRSTSEDWKYLGDHTISLLLNDSTRLMFEGDHDGTVGDGYVLEFVSFDMPTPEFVELVDANRVEGELGSTPFRFSSDDLMALRDFASRMAPVGPS